MSLFQLGSTVSGQLENVCHALWQIDWRVRIDVLGDAYSIEALVITRGNTGEEAILVKGQKGWNLFMGPRDPKVFLQHWKWISVIDNLGDKQLMDVLEELVRAGKQ